jgi:hypothetical protein
MTPKEIHISREFPHYTRNRSNLFDAIGEVVTSNEARSQQARIAVMPGD